VSIKLERTGACCCGVKIVNDNLYFVVSPITSGTRLCDWGGSVKIALAPNNVSKVKISRSQPEMVKALFFQTPSGVYFYKIDAVSLKDPSKSFIQVKKINQLYYRLNRFDYRSDQVVRGRARSC
jgi:hypothetical protein